MERSLFESYRGDPHKPVIEEPHDVGYAFLWSLIPGGGYFYLNRAGLAVFVGILFYPISVFTTIRDAKTLNRKYVASEYARIRGIGAAHGQQQQQQQQQVIVVGSGGATPTAKIGGGQSKLDQLEQLGEMRRKGLLTEEEFLREKDRILSRE